ncbi:hypothetical protein, partial [Pseudomonas amygdali]|uniref:hypothetical protein n=1 Tax=Pseudomonas amygdali TaxID=47877 RepID=UPI0019D39B13
MRVNAFKTDNITLPQDNLVVTYTTTSEGNIKKPAILNVTLFSCTIVPLRDASNLLLTSLQNDNDC